MMQQLSIEYFFPLTEQLELDLDFTKCSPHLYYLKAQGQPREGPFPTGTIYKFADGNVTPVLQIDVDQCPITLLSKDEPSLIKKCFYKIMGITWKIK